ncbi:hypothetical protein GLAREA_05635 [Glarea lozoyensis ATCC 20868]|uniref:Uncharacterized protein n=1 Tax=Glarea lozoyensis (strain ATCC 20868 / MF5171) TaxID=1116229 RepID=S3DD45_GLAL2|nr:uncharacterized protein GLAREA_05635 [Glarea lozoyensis ATCC 20868]EPE36297.1 hypothetical protein GLAREA_05635 [Glarea lozoyensis ATCC 20868]
MDGYRSWSMMEWQSRFPSSAVLPRTLNHSKSIGGLSGGRKSYDPEHNERYGPHKLSFDPSVKSASHTPRRRRHKITLESTRNDENSSETSPGISPTPPTRPNTLSRAYKSSSGSNSACATAGNLWVLSSRKPSKLSVLESAAPSSSNHNEEAFKFSPSDSMVPGSRPEPNFSPSNHHPDLVFSLPADSSTTSTIHRVTSSLNGTPLPEGSFDKTKSKLPTGQLPKTPPISPPIIRHLPAGENSSFDQEYFSVDTDPVDLGEDKPCPLACQNYADRQGLLWDRASRMLERHFLNPASLTQSEFASLVSNRDEDISNWLQSNISPIIHRTVANWTQVNRDLVEAGISLCELKEKFLDEIEFMDHSEQMEFIQSYKLIESRVITAMETLNFTAQQRRELESMSIVEKYDYITSCVTLQELEETIAPSKTINDSRKPNCRQTKVDYLKAEIAEKLRHLQLKLEEMKSMDKSTDKLEDGLSRTTKSRVIWRSEDYDHDNVELPSYGEPEKEHLNKLSIVRTAPVYRQRVAHDDPFIDRTDWEGKPFYDYSSPSQYPRANDPTTWDLGSSISDCTSVPYYDGIEYQHYVDNNWRCYEDRAISITKRKDPGAVLPIPDQAVDSSVKNRVLYDTPDIYEKAQKAAKEISDIYQVLERRSVSSPKTHENYKTGDDEQHRDSAVCIERDLLPNQRKENVTARNTNTIPVIKKPSMCSILSESSTTSVHVVLRKVSASKPDHIRQNLATSIHIELVDAHDNAISSDVGKSSFEAGKEDVLSVDLPRNRSVRKKISRFFGSLKRGSLRRKGRPNVVMDE